MKKYLISFISLLLLASPLLTNAAISYKQTAHGTGVLSMTATLSGVTAGDAIVIAWDETNLSNSTTTDSNGTPIFLASTTNWHGTNKDQVFYEANVAAGSHAVTVTFSSSTNFSSINIFEYSGVATTSPVDKSVTQICAGCATGPVTSPVMTSTVANDMAFGFGDSAGDTLTAITGFTIRGANTSEDNATSSMALGAGVSTTFSGFAGADWSDIGILLKPTALTPVFAADVTITNSCTIRGGVTIR